MTKKTDKQLLMQAVQREGVERLDASDPERLFIQHCTDWTKTFFERNSSRIGQMDPIVVVRTWEEGGGPSSDPICQGTEVSNWKNILAGDFGAFRGGELVVMSVTGRRCGVIDLEIKSVSGAVDELRRRGLQERTLFVLEPRMGQFFIHNSLADLESITDNVFEIQKWLMRGSELTAEILDESLNDIYRQHIKYPRGHMVKHVWDNPKSRTMVARPEVGIQRILVLGLVLIRTIFRAQIRPEDHTASGRIDITITVPRDGRKLEMYLCELKVIKPDEAKSSAEAKIRLSMHQAITYRADCDECETVFACNYNASDLDLDITTLEAEANQQNVLLRLYPLASKLASAGP